MQRHKLISHFSVCLPSFEPWPYLRPIDFLFFKSSLLGDDQDLEDLWAQIDDFSCCVLQLTQSYLGGFTPIFLGKRRILIENHSRHLYDVICILYIISYAVAYCHLVFCHMAKTNPRSPCTFAGPNMWFYWK